MLVRAVIKHDDFGDGETTAIRLTGRTGPYPRPLYCAVFCSPHKCLRRSSFYRAISHGFDRKRRVITSLKGGPEVQAGGSGRLIRPSPRRRPLAAADADADAQLDIAFIDGPTDRTHEDIRTPHHELQLGVILA
jgi:hypothetical protein